MVELKSDFVPMGEVSADERSRMAFGKAGVHRDDRYAVAVNAEGEILLTPLVSIPRRELLVWDDEGIRAALVRGLEHSSKDETSEGGDFTRYAEEDHPLEDENASAEPRS
ncbi:hypothetical protein E3O45_03305 [Cryobacterium sp. TMS1-20-1]|uniref:Uncharacterized protein n=1 Tax=Cryobacterium levicorallinum TaxID=995038 RepID=A0A1I3CF41_9MICO|nr:MULTISPECIES: hypothetical protein [Cryobacterium]TFB88799.1 hypothetical protein E3O11_01815 [Cryobacterium levicorallinum]TFC80167.1 hypothetical protein E3O45_03305 [Cryobacterium sp. TMS1-20-1]TFD48253.1 hypothetical protein E3T46_15985 [Cryobacterium sp. Hh11]TFD53354.1 hypothetical protein E3T43_13890 [Cryobacterium sp. Hh7]TFD55986.1 hypothetical protein E3T41_16820 [Cryobacterium sp. Hh38]